jgi:hypothetical protein
LVDTLSPISFFPGNFFQHSSNQQVYSASFHSFSFCLFPIKYFKVQIDLISWNHSPPIGYFSSTSTSSCFPQTFKSSHDAPNNFPQLLHYFSETSPPLPPKMTPSDNPHEILSRKITKNCRASAKKEKSCLQHMRNVDVLSSWENNNDKKRIRKNKFTYLS